MVGWRRVSSIMALIIYGASYAIRTACPNTLISFDFVTFCPVLRFGLYFARTNSKTQEDRMKLSRLTALACALSFAAALAGCSSDLNANTGENANANANAAASPSPAAQTLSEVERPQKVKDMMQERGDEDSAKPALKIVEPKEGATVKGSTVKLKLDLSGDLKGY